VAGLGGGDVGADFPVGFTERVCAEEVQDFGIGEDGGLRVEDLWMGEGQWARVGRLERSRRELGRGYNA
jgi:hypothetical protein